MANCTPRLGIDQSQGELEVVLRPARRSRSSAWSAPVAEYELRCRKMAAASGGSPACVAGDRIEVGADDRRMAVDVADPGQPFVWAMCSPGAFTRVW